ncbi:peptidoglycan editing factor PgeF [Aciduricibacillus chroicocephali]|uniref:Purine nucleoside phosphorylase n=1 Tax=Aciduricibacillus chroicocephali TaxID=3054939 RepID=A0ABY9KY92_9BACI|nr:peptidoglycan editing factor PgeF [Bacillaceae bacterium 44XB]
MTEPFVKDQAEPSILFIDFWQNEMAGLVAGFTRRAEGVSGKPFNSFNFGLHTNDKKENVIKNRELLAERLDFPLTDWVLAEQIHGTEIAVAGKEECGRGTMDLNTAIKGVDGLVIDQSGILCAAFFADCVPLFFLDVKKQIAGIAHAGWRGTVGGMAGKMIERLLAMGSELQDLRVAIGPCISGDNYEVDNRVIEQIPEKFRPLVVKHLAEERFLLDLRKLNHSLLLEAGVKDEQIEVTERCTFADEDDFYSYRRDQGNTGRMLGFIGFK